MLSRTALRAATPLRQGFASNRLFSTSLAHNKNVAVLGASGGIGQPLSLLLKTNPLVTELRLFDVRLAPGVAADVSHINTPAITTGYSPDGSEGGLEKAVEGADVILIPAGVPRKPGMTRDDLFNTNASIVRDLAKTCAKVAPKAHMLIIANPVNSTVPIVAEVYKKAGVYDAKKLYGVTTLDVTRSSTFLSGIAGLKPSEVVVPVVGGHAGATIVPLLSQAGTASKSVQGGEQYEKLVHRIQYGGDEVVKAKDGAGSATLSMAYAAAVFAESLLKALNGETGIKECAYVDSPLYQKEGATFFATPVTLGKDGVQEIHPVGTVSSEEQKLIEAAIPELKKSIEKGISWVAENP